jgi:RNA polymerase primary sigma factor
MMSSENFTFEDDWALRNGIERRSSLDRRMGEERRSGDRRGLGSSIDPMNIYLREMGGQRLLSHQEEMELARMMEDGETRIQHAVLRLTLGVTALNDLAENLLRGTLRINAVIRGLSENDEERSLPRCVMPSSTRLKRPMNLMAGGASCLRN